MKENSFSRNLQLSSAFCSFHFYPYPFSLSIWFFLCRQMNAGAHFSSQCRLQSRFFSLAQTLVCTAKMGASSSHIVTIQSNIYIHTYRAKEEEGETDRAHIHISIFPRVGIYRSLVSRFPIPRAAQLEFTIFESADIIICSEKSLSYERGERNGACHLSAPLYAPRDVYHVGWNDQFCPNRDVEPVDFRNHSYCRSAADGADIRWSNKGTLHPVHIENQDADFFLWF